MHPLQHVSINSKGEARLIELTASGTTQCVGFARHWLEINMHMTFSDVENAETIWQKTSHYKSLLGDKKHLVLNHINGFAKAPQFGDLIIYNRHLDVNGHVAVVIAIDEKNKTVSVVEQNYMNRYQSPDTRRYISYLTIDNCFRLLQDHILGWKHIYSNNRSPDDFELNHNHPTTLEK